MVWLRSGPGLATVWLYTHPCEGSVAVRVCNQMGVIGYGNNAKVVVGRAAIAGAEKK